MDIKQKLCWFIQAGITSFCAEKPSHACQPTQVSDEPPASQQATTTALKAKDLPSLNKEKQDFSLSSLKKTATQAILGQGPAKPSLMCIIETPDTESDKTGSALQGAQADQLTKMMAAIHLDMQHVYVTYLSPWRTPGNRPLTESERALFLPFLVREIELVQPQKILLFGASLAHALLKTESLAKARGQWHDWQGIPVRVTLALSSLKTTPLRQQAWDDLQEVEKLI